MRAAILLLLASLSLIACDKPQQQVQEDPEVFVVTVEEQPYKPSRGFNGRIRSSTDVDIMAQITGELIAIHFKEGDNITAGSPLFDIDPAAYRAAAAKAKADLARTQANQANALKNYERGKKLIEDGFISASEFDTLEARHLESAAATQAAEAALESANVDLAYTSIKAPQDGRVGRSNPAIGDIVSPQYGALTSLVGQDGMDVVFQLPEKLLLSLRHNESDITVADINVSLELPDGSLYEETGKVDYFSNRVDPRTGTLETMAHMPNPNDFLRPGMFVKVILQLNHPLKGLMVPQAAVQVDQRGTYVLAVDENNMVVRKNLITGERRGENTLVNSGLDAGTRVIIRGVQQARPGQKVQASVYKPATEASEGENSDQ